MDNLLAYYEAPPAGCFREEVKNMADFTVTYTLALPVGLQINFNFSTLEYFEYFRKNVFLTYIKNEQGQFDHLQLCKLSEKEMKY